MILRSRRIDDGFYSLLRALQPISCQYLTHLDHALGINHVLIVVKG